MKRKSWTEDSQEGRGPARGAGCRPRGAGLGVSLGISHWLRAGEVGEAEIPVAPSSLLGFGSSGAARLPPPTESQRGPGPAGITSPLARRGSLAWAVLPLPWRDA